MSCSPTSTLIPATSSSFSHSSLRLNQGVTGGSCACLRPSGQSESVSCRQASRQVLGKECVSFADFEKAAWKSSTSNRRRRCVARAGDSAIVRAVVASAEEETKVIAPEDVLIDENKQRQDQERVGVLLLNLGGPDTLEDVQPFLYNLFADPVHFSELLKICSAVLQFTNYNVSVDLGNNSVIHIPYLHKWDWNYLFELPVHQLYSYQG